MGFFDLFSKKKKETLDNGLAKTKESVFGKIARAVAGKSKVDEEVLDNLEEVLITSDVGVDTTLEITRLTDIMVVCAILLYLRLTLHGKLQQSMTSVLTSLFSMTNYPVLLTILMRNAKESICYANICRG